MTAYTLNYSGRPSPVTLNMVSGAVVNGFSGANTTLNAELTFVVGSPTTYNAAADTLNITGTAFADNVTMNASNGNTLSLGAGDDTVTITTTAAQTGSMTSTRGCRPPSTNAS